MEFSAKDREILANALADSPDFLAPRERQTFVRMNLERHPFGGEVVRTLGLLDWSGGPQVVAYNLVQRLEGQEVAPGVPALKVLAEALHGEKLADLRRRLGWCAPEPLPAVEGEVFDVFLCHNSQDKPEVRGIAELIRKAGLNPWLDVWHLRPGFRWQPEIERQIETIKAAAVFVSDAGFGPWHEEEADAIPRSFKNGNRPVIPVILASATGEIEFPPFLDGRTRVDFRKREPDPLRQLVFGITGK